MKLRDVKSCLLGSIFPFLVVASLVAWYYPSSPIDKARTHLSEQGIDPANLELIGFENSSLVAPVVFSTEKVRFRVKGTDPTEKREVELFRYVYFLPWQVTALREVEQ